MAIRFHQFLFIAIFVVSFAGCSCSRVSKDQLPVIKVQRFCVARRDLSFSDIQKILDGYCKKPEVDCNEIRIGGSCFEPNTDISHASVLLDQYFVAHNGANEFCDPTVGFITPAIISKTCKYLPASNR